MRQQHYRFAHVLLATAILRDPESWLARLRSQGAGALAPIWRLAGEGLGPLDLADGSALGVSGIDGGDGVLITMPAPTAATECHCIAVVRASDGEIRYFVLERGVDNDDGTARAFWAEWRQPPMGMMRIRGQDVVPVSPAAFLAAVGEEIGVPLGRGPAGGAFDGVAEALSGSAPAITGSAFGTAAAALGGQNPPSVGGQGAFGASAATPASAVPSAAFGPAPTAQVPKRKKGRAGLLVGCGCATVFAAMLLIGGVLLYLEEGRDYNDPGSEVASAPIQPGVPFALAFKWDGTNYASSDLWLVVDGTTENGQFNVKGQAGCSRSGAPDLRDFEESLSGYNAANVDRSGSSFTAWFRIHDEYARSSSTPFKCGGVVLPEKGTIKKARIVVTQRQRPSDWISF